MQVSQGVLEKFLFNFVLDKLQEFRKKLQKTNISKYKKSIAKKMQIYLEDDWNNKDLSSAESFAFAL